MGLIYVLTSFVIGVFAIFIIYDEVSFGEASSDGLDHLDRILVAVLMEETGCVHFFLFMDDKNRI